MNIKKVTSYICPETGKKFSNEKDAKASALKSIEDKKLAEQTAQLNLQKQLRLNENRHWLRLNLEDISTLPKFNAAFTDVSNSHFAPIGKKTNWSRDPNGPKYFPGWCGRIVIKMRTPLVGPISSSDSIKAFLFDNYSPSVFVGFHSGCGCTGSLQGKYSMDMDFSFFLEDFPKLIEKKSIYDKKQNLIKQHHSNTLTYHKKLSTFIESNESMLQLKTQQQEIYKKIALTSNLLESQFTKKNPIPLLTLPPECDIIDKTFKSYSL